ncbi:MAG: AMP-binding protein [Firmicutes bacterium]|nr:AMP-binding protein [Bacillota bacterium]
MKRETPNLPRSLPYPETTMFGAVAEAARLYPDSIAWVFMGKKTKYSRIIPLFEQAARAFAAAGVQRGDFVTICMPNCPQAVICLYALNRIGAVANMVHPLSAQGEITHYLTYSGSKMMLTLDLFYEKSSAARDAADPHIPLLVARMQSELPPHLALAYYAVKGKDFHRFPNRAGDLLWTDFVKTGGNTPLPPVEYDPQRTAVMLYSGGTTGTAKGICLSDFNFNALGMQIRECAGCDFRPGLKFLSVMPIFHGFGLGIGIHTVLENAATSILIPQFTNDSYAKLVKQHKPNFIAGVPSIFESMIHNPAMEGADLSCLIGVFSGGDTLPPQLKEQADQFLREHKATVQIREGYGLTECVTASCVTPVDTYKRGSIGLPLRDMAYKIVEPGTFRELPRGEEGEIILSGPTLMLGYYKNEEQTEETIRTDGDGTRWLFTGDIGTIDADGYVYYVRRMKRMIITNGYNVYPSQLERELDQHPDVHMSCVIGVPHQQRGQMVKAYIQLEPGVAPTKEEHDKLMAFCRHQFAGFARPREIEFRESLPLTLVGKVAYHILEEEAAEK